MVVVAVVLLATRRGRWHEGQGRGERRRKGL